MTPDTEVNEIGKFLSDVFSWSAVLEPSKRHPLGSPPIALYRGESELYQFPCMSSLGRLIAGSEVMPDTIAKEWHSLEKWVQQSQQAEERLYPGDAWTRAMWARHHGMHNRLTDWSLNPLVALWMACGGNSASTESDGFIYVCADSVFNRQSIESHPFPRHKLVLKRNAFFPEEQHNRDHLFVLPPEDFHPRIRRQSGVFHVSCSPTATALDSGAPTFVGRVPGNRKVEILNQLRICNIHGSALGIHTPDEVASRISAELKEEYSQNADGG